jgi:hypothetical protein
VLDHPKMRAIRKSLSGDSEAPAVLVVTFRLREHRFGLGPTFSRCEHCTIPGHLAHGFIADGWVVCTENIIRIDCVTESPNVGGDDRSAMLVPDRVRRTVQVEAPT